VNSVVTGKSTPGLLKSSLLYAIGDFVTKGARIILVPYFLAYLTQAELGELAVLTVIAFATWTLTAFGLGMTVQRQYFDYGDQSDAFVVTVWFGRLIGGLPILGLLLLCGWTYGELTGHQIPSHLIAVAICGGYLRGGMILIESWYIAREQPLRYRLFTFLQFLSITSLIVGLVSGLDLGVAGAIYGEFIGYVVWTFVAGILLLKAARPNLGLVNWPAVFTYSLPVIPHGFFMWGLSGIDRLIMQQMQVPLDRIGVYDIAYQLATYLSIVTLALRAAWLPKYFKQHKSILAEQERGVEKANKFNVGPEFSKTFSLYIRCVSVAAVCGWMLAPEGFSILMRGNFDAYLQTFRIVLAGNFVMAFFTALNVPLLAEKRTGIVACISCFGLTINVVATVLLVPHLQILGAAVSTVLAYSVMVAIIFATLRLRYKIDWQWDVLLVLPTLAFTLMFATYSLNAAWRWGLLLRLLLLAIFTLISLLPLIQARLRRAPNRQPDRSAEPQNFLANEVQK
jgi:O-antigen/teichoic acid export membrane protein